VDRSILKVTEMSSVLAMAATTTATIDFCLSAVLWSRPSSAWTDRTLSGRFVDFVDVTRFVRGHLGSTRSTFVAIGGGSH
jgi:hypothetical protein